MPIMSCDMASFAKQAKIIAMIEIVTSIISLLTITVTALLMTLSPSIRENIDHQDPHNIFNILIHFPLTEKLPMVLVPTFYFVGELCLAIWLLKCIEEKNYKRCRIWYIITITICLTGFYFFIPGVIFTDENFSFISIFIVSYLFTLYSVWVVHSFMKELKSTGLHRPIEMWDDDLDKF
ncbi:uncharacterized protein LOC110859874 [Folsomia candida]|uniref:Uncharacterized protein n=1 Tax=Folsomia candida TaxID=158441 RepID=A0A226DB49_FOLCA|nr:uncharacterized protein LOC110859874 [Folsomia candida]OXA41861.1 hypothetical protein Fcan01_23384 [Folsomia candida]